MRMRELSVSALVTDGPAAGVERASCPNWIGHVQARAGVRTRKMVWRSLSSGGRFVSGVHYESYPSKALLVSLSRKLLFRVGIFVYTSPGFIFNVNMYCDLFFCASSNLSLFEGEKIVGLSRMGSLNFSLFFLTFFITT